MTIKSASAPVVGDKFEWKDNKGKLLVIEPLEHKTGIMTAQYGEKDAVRANVYVITGPDTSEDYLDTLIFPGYLVAQTKTQIGETIAGRLGSKETPKGEAWIIQEATSDDLDKAQAWDAARSKRQFATVGASSAAPF